MDSKVESKKPTRLQMCLASVGQLNTELEKVKQMAIESEQVNIAEVERLKRVNEEDRNGYQIRVSDFNKQLEDLNIKLNDTTKELVDGVNEVASLRNRITQLETKNYDSLTIKQIFGLLIKKFKKNG